MIRRGATPGRSQGPGGCQGRGVTKETVQLMEDKEPLDAHTKGTIYGLEV